MELAALILSAIAVWFFLAKKDVTKGLSLLTVAWCVQLILNWIRVDANIS